MKEDELELTPAEEIQPEEITQAVTIINQSGLEKTKGQQILELFTPFFNEMARIEKKINSLNSINPQQDDVNIAREIRLALKNNRVSSEKKKDELKAGILVEGRVIDNLNNIVKNLSKENEMKCEQIEKFAEIQQAKREAELKHERSEKLSPYVDDVAIFPLGQMSEQAWNDLYIGMKSAHEARVEAEKKAEADRLAKIEADRIEQERIRKENEVLRAENAKIEAAAEKSRQDALAAALEKEKEFEKEHKAAEQAAEKQRKIDETARDKARAEAQKAKDAALKAEAEARWLKDAETKRLKYEQAVKDKAEKDRVAAEKKAAKLPDKRKLQQTIDGFFLPVVTDLKTTDAVNVLNDIHVKFTAFKKWATDQINSL